MAKGKTVAKIVYTTDKEYTIEFSIGENDTLDKKILDEVLDKKELELRNNYGHKLKALSRVYVEDKK